MRVEHTQDTAKMPRAGFEDREGHRTPCASVQGLHRIAPMNVNVPGRCDRGTLPAAT